MTRILTTQEQVKFKQALIAKGTRQDIEADNYGCSRGHFNYVLNGHRPATPSFIDFIHELIITHMAA